MSAPQNYSNSHKDPEKPAQYDGGFWQWGTTKNQLWKLEQQLIQAELDRLNTPNFSVLDFACGTGRITSLLENTFSDVTGVDISAPMAQLAQQRCPNATILVGDILGEKSIIDRQFDLITSFRFFLNAEQSLRKAILEKLWEQLKPGGRLLVNFHLNPTSMTGLYFRARSLLKKNSLPMLSVQDARTLLEDQGLVIETVQGYGFLPKHKIYPRWPHASLWVENQLLSLPIPATAAHSFMVTAIKPND